MFDEQATSNSKGPALVTIGHTAPDGDGTTAFTASDGTAIPAAIVVVHASGNLIAQYTAGPAEGAAPVRQSRIELDESGGYELTVAIDPEEVDR
ncbi:hypothetical protein [Nocardia sp. NPDC058705]|uniref:hypothetical protein n=1 Tax=Nocardia sp. NPDC058705 TaxID=3346609 RepID=UPI00368E7708